MRNIVMAAVKRSSHTSTKTRVGPKVRTRIRLFGLWRIYVACACVNSHAQVPLHNKLEANPATVRSAYGRQSPGTFLYIKLSKWQPNVLIQSPLHV